jgi:uncharacterized protein (DUF111 family)
MGKGVILLMAQVDDAPGELLGRVIQTMGEMGAKNVQLLSSLGKKGRPGYVLLVDILAEDEDEFASLLVGELGIWGYRVLESQHKHFEIRRYSLSLDVECGGSLKSFPLRVKRIFSGGEFMRAKAEHDDLSYIAAQLSMSHRVPLAVLKASVETALGSDEPGARLRVHLPAASA